ncbi:MAG: hypothetical protein E7172_03690 [Firmicutes bacterium]|nr:hypothetical protein [Bacillota bacterium]
MLKKLLKYDLQNIYKGVIIFYLLSLFFGILTRIFFLPKNSFIINVIAQICSGTTITMFINILINNLMRLWVRFNNNFYGDESYLTHTLPIDKKTLYLSKIFASIITLFTSAMVICLTLFIAYYSQENIEFIKNLLLPLATVYESTVIVIILAVILVCILEIINILYSGYVGIVIGHKFLNNKIAFSVLFGFITYIITQIFTVLLVFIGALFNKDLMNLFYTTEFVNINTIKLCIYMAIIIYTINIIILYLVNLKLFNKGVNVD